MPIFFFKLYFTFFFILLPFRYSKMAAGLLITHRFPMNAENSRETTLSELYVFQDLYVLTEKLMRLQTYVHILRLE